METTATKKYIGETCIICETKKQKGIHLYTQFICNDCEREIISTDTRDERYKYYLNQLKKIVKPEQFS